MVRARGGDGPRHRDPLPPRPSRAFRRGLVLMKPANTPGLLPVELCVVVLVPGGTAAPWRARYAAGPGSGPRRWGDRCASTSLGRHAPPSPGITAPWSVAVARMAAAGSGSPRAARSHRTRPAADAVCRWPAAIPFFSKGTFRTGEAAAATATADRPPSGAGCSRTKHFARTTSSDETSLSPISPRDHGL